MRPSTQVLVAGFVFGVAGFFFGFAVTLAANP